MGRRVLSGNPQIEIDVRTSPRARRMTLRVAKLDGKVTLTVPPRVPERQITAFLDERAAWLRKHLAGAVRPQLVTFGQVIPFEGAPHQIEQGPGRGVRKAPGVLLVGGSAQTMPRRLGAYLKEAARDRLSAASDRYAAQVGRSYAKIALRDTRSRWGSCSTTGTLSYSWRLILAPPAALDYVAAHEVAHLVHMNHSAAFWDQVEAIYPGWQAQRDWLRREGTALHQYRFTAKD